MIVKEIYVKVPGVGRYNLYPFGDLQFGAPGFHAELWEKFVNEVQADQHPLLVGLGDYSDNFRPTVQTKIGVMTADDPGFRNAIDEMYDGHLDNTIEKLKPVLGLKKAIILGLCQGHHYYKYESGITSDQKIANYFKTSFLEEMAYIRLVFYSGDHPIYTKRRWAIKIHAQHGDGGAGFSGPDVSNLERKTVPYWNADLYLRGHSTKRWTVPMLEYDLTTDHPVRMIERYKWAVNTGGFMRGHIEGQSTYVSRKNMPPAALGYSVVHIDLERHRQSKNYVRESNAVTLSVTQM